VINEHDNQTIRCSKLGHEVNFKYCRIMNDRLPCREIAGCWQRRFDIHGFLIGHYQEEELERLCLPQKPKIEALVELMEKAKKAKKESP